MMEPNKHIEIVKKWLADKDSVSLEELEANREAAATAYAAYADDAAAYYAADYAADAAYADDAVYDDAYYAAAAAYWVKGYEELTK